jgi:hypothetical protein
VSCFQPAALTIPCRLSAAVCLQALRCASVVGAALRRDRSRGEPAPTVWISSASELAACNQRSKTRPGNLLNKTTRRAFRRKFSRSCCARQIPARGDRQSS